MVNHCMHGPDAIIEEILDWRPWDYLTDRSTMPGGAPVLFSTFELEPTAQGTIVHARFAPKTAKDRAMLAQMGPMLTEAITEGFKALSAQAAEEAQAQAEGRELEPELPAPKKDGLFSELGPLVMVG